MFLVALWLGGAGVIYALPTESLRVVAMGGERYVALRDLAVLYGYDLRMPPGRRVYLRSRWSNLEFEVDSRQARVAGTIVWLHAPVRKVFGRWSVAETDALKVLDPMLAFTDDLARRSYDVVVLDPGHGGADRGARGRRGVEEKRVTLDVAKRVRRHLAREGIRVYLTRETDKTMALDDRCKIAAQRKANVLVSIHLNAAPNSRAGGVETYVLTAAGYPSTAAGTGGAAPRTQTSAHAHNEANTLLGFFLQRALVRETGLSDRGLRRARFLVLRNAPCPAALVECGFVSNRDEEEKLLMADFREAIARAIARGVLDYAAAIRNAKELQRKAREAAAAGGGP